MYTRRLQDAILSCQMSSTRDYKSLPCRRFITLPSTRAKYLAQSSQDIKICPFQLYPRATVCKIFLDRRHSWYMAVLMPSQLPSTPLLTLHLACSKDSSKTADHGAGFQTAKAQPMKLTCAHGPTPDSSQRRPPRSSCSQGAIAMHVRSGGAEARTPRPTRSRSPHKIRRREAVRSATDRICCSNSI